MNIKEFTNKREVTNASIKPFVFMVISCPCLLMITELRQDVNRYDSTMVNLDARLSEIRRVRIFVIHLYRRKLDGILP